MQNLISNFLLALKIPISKKYCEKLIASHPDYPSLLSIADTFERLGINYNIARIEREDIISLPFPYFLHTNEESGKLIYIKNEKDLTRSNSDLQHWSGIVLQVEPTDIITDKENDNLLAEEKLLKRAWYVLASAIIPVLIYAIANQSSWPYILLLITSIAGSMVGYFLIAKDLGIKYEAVESFCNAGKNTNCDKILNSEDSKLLGIIKFSDAVLAYFVFQSISLSVITALPNVKESFLFVLSFLSVLTVPVILFSLYYQYFRAKSWCRLCLVVDLILALQAVVFFFIATYYESNIQIANISFRVAIILLLLLFGLVSFILLLKTSLMKINRLDEVEVKYNRMKNSVPIFSHLLSRQKKIDATVFKNELSVGDPNAPINIIVASNLYCNPCKEQHEVISQLIDRYSDKINIAIRFVLSGADRGRNPTSNRYIIQYWMQNIYGKNNASADTLKLIHDWFLWMDLEKFMKIYPLEDNTANAESEKLEKQHYEWNHQQGIALTPTFFINGHQLPPNFTIGDLLGLVPGLAESIQKAEIKENALQNA